MLKKHKAIIGSVLLSGAVLGAAVIGHAQQTPPQQQYWMMGPGMMGHHMLGPGMSGPMGMMPGPMIEGRLAYLKAELAITEAQSAAWTGYVTAVKTRTTSMQGMHQTMAQAMQSGTAVARLDAHVMAMEAMIATLKALKPATEALYAVLTPDQKVKADLLLGMGCCMM